MVGVWPRLALGLVASLAWFGFGPNMGAGRRRLSKSDGRFWRGQQRSVGRPRRELYVFVHIPKAAGASFLKDSHEYVASGSAVKGTHEKAYFHRYTQGLMGKPRARLAVMLRHPMRLAYSQFMMCKYSIRSGKLFPRGDETMANATWNGFETWARQFVAGQGSFAYGCYDPVDLQTRYLSTSHSAWRAPAEALNVSRALATLESAFFVGLVDAYEETTCVLRYLSTGGAADYCGCGSAAPRPPVTHERHNLPPYSIWDLDRPKFQLLARLVPNDLVLYNAAIDRYAADRDRAEAATGAGTMPCADSVTRLKLGLHATLCAAFGRTNDTGGLIARRDATCDFDPASAEGDVAPIHDGRHRRRRRKKKKRKRSGG